MTWRSKKAKLSGRGKVVRSGHQVPWVRQNKGTKSEREKKKKGAAGPEKAERTSRSSSWDQAREDLRNAKK